MTSINSYGSATTSGNYTLCFSGTLLGLWVDSFTSAPRRLTEIAERQNFWSSEAILDGSYPCFVWDTEFQVYCESASLVDYLNGYFTMSSKFFNQSRPLELRYGDTTDVVIDFGDCFMKPFTQEEPGNLLQHRAGIQKYVFTSVDAPTVVATV